MWNLTKQLAPRICRRQCHNRKRHQVYQPRSRQANGTAVPTAVRTWQLLPAVQYPKALGLDLLSLSPTLAQDQVVTGHGGWSDERTRTTWRSLDGGVTWEAWTPPLAYAAGT